MNRQQRRFLARKGNAEMVVGQVVKDERKQAVRNTASVALEFFRVTMALALHDEFRFGSGRIARVLKRMDVYSDCINHDNIQYDELKDLVHREIGIDFDD